MNVRTILSVFSVIVICLIAVGSGAEDQPEKRVMNYIAVMDLKCTEEIGKDNCVLLTNIVVEELVRSKKYTVIDRANREKILGEVGFQQTGCVEGGCMVEAGRILGVGKIVVGSVNKLGETYFVTLQIVNVETAAVEIAEKSKCQNCKLDSLADTVANAARKLMGLEPVSSVHVTQPDSQPRITQPRLEEKRFPKDMVYVPAGAFMMGCNSSLDDECGDDEKPYHKVYLDAFYIDKYEVSVDRFGACVRAGKCKKPITRQYYNWGVPGRGNHPINGVSLNEAVSYCAYVGKRLPTEAEWEKAARGNDGRKYPWGNMRASCDFAVMNEGAKGCGRNSTWPVGSKTDGASPYGAMDMLGNVWEWTADFYDGNYYAGSPGRNPKGPSSGSYVVLRGGGYNSATDELRTSYRFSLGTNHSYYAAGFRCVRN